MHREHNNDEPTEVDKDRTYSFGLENTHRFNEQTSLITGISYDKRDASRAEKFEKQCVSTHQKMRFARLISVINTPLIIKSNLPIISLNMMNLR